MEQGDVREPAASSIPTPGPNGDVSRIPTWLLMLMVALFVPGSLLIGSIGLSETEGALSTSPLVLMLDTAWLLLFAVSGWLLYRRSTVATKLEPILFLGLALGLTIVSLGSEAMALLYGESELIWYLAQRPGLIELLTIVIGLLYLIELAFVFRLLWLGTQQLRNH